MKFIINLIIFVYVSIVVTKGFEQKTEKIDLPGLGSVVGIAEKDLNYEAFYGIPFGEPPIGNNRFGNFKAVNPWNNLLEAFEPKSRCVQKNIFFGKNSLVTGIEDCLYLNIYRPKESAKVKPLPVMVLIHGGGFFSGNAHPDTYGPEKLMKTGKLILITFQYRLGPLGFFSTNDSAAQGNQGFKDQTGALKFIYKYIKYFNGNHKNITLLGHGAGAASVHLHTMSQHSRGLFNQIILLSGSGIAPYNEPTKDPAEQAYQLAEYAGINGAYTLDTTELVEKLKEIDARKLIQAADNFHTNGIDPVVIFKLVLEDPSNENAFITKHPKEMSKNGDLNYVPILTGILENDGSVRTLAMINNKTEIRRFNKNFDENLAVLLDVENSEKYLGKIINYYLNGKHELNEETFNGFQKVVTDRAFIYPFYDTLNDILKFTDKSIRLYKFDGIGEISFSSIYSPNYDPKIKGPFHGDDLLDLFYFKSFSKSNSKSNEHANDMSSFLDFIVEFVTGESVKNSEICSLEIWESNLKQNQICPYTYFGDNHNVSINNAFRVEDVKFWYDLYNAK